MICCTPVNQEGIDFAAGQAGLLVIGVMPDEYVAKTKGPHRPINPQMVRVERVDEAAEVDYSLVVKPGLLAAASLFRQLRPDIYVEEAAHAASKSRLKRAYLGMLGIEYLVDHRPSTGSTTAMIEQLGLDQAQANAGFGYRAAQTAA